MKRLISFVFVILLLVSFSTPAFAVISLPPGAGAASFWDWLGVNSTVIDDALESTSDALFGEHAGCPDSPNGLHLFQFDVPAGALTGNYQGICGFCGQSYSDYASGQYENNLQVTTPETEGGAYLTLDHIDADGDYWFIYHPAEISVNPYSYDTILTSSFSNGIQSVHYVAPSSASNSSSITVTYSLAGIAAPFEGVYTPYGVVLSASFTHLNTHEPNEFRAFGSYLNSTTIFPYYKTLTTSFSRTSGSSLNFNTPAITNYYSLTYGDAYICYMLECRPTSTLPVGVYNTYITDVTGDIVYDDSVHTDVQIVDRTNDIVYNPVTDTSYNIANYAYDYSSFTMDVTTDEGDTITVTYGDEYITYAEHVGDVTNTYNFYYAVPASVEPTPTPSVPGGTGGDVQPSGGVLAKINELIAYSNTLFSRFGEFASNVGEFFGDLLDFFAAVFVFIPTEIWTIVGLGFTLIIICVVLKVFLR